MVELPEDPTLDRGRPPSAGLYRPPSAPARRGLLSKVASGIGDMPIRVVYLFGAVLLTVLAVFLVFTLFAGDNPSGKPVQVEHGRTAVPSATASAKPTSTASVLPKVPEKMSFATLPGKASVIIGLVVDKTSKIIYPRLGEPWATRSAPPFSVAQRVGEVTQPHTMVVSALLPVDAPAVKPKTSDGYRDVAVSAVKWSLRTQFPADSKITWSGSQALAMGKGWILGFQVRYLVDGQPKTAQALVAVVQIDGAKPAMLLATIPESGKAYWRDINTLVKGVRPI